MVEKTPEKKISAESSKPDEGVFICTSNTEGHYYAVPGDLLGIITTDPESIEASCSISNSVPLAGKFVKRIQTDKGIELRAESLGMVRLEGGRIFIQSTVSVAEDRMSAIIDLHPPSDPKRILEIDQVKKTLANHGISYGIQEASLQRAIKEVNDAEKPQLAVLAAKGKPVILAKDGKITWHINPKEGGDAETVVKLGEVVATADSRNLGMPGMDITGQPIPAGAASAQELPKLDSISVTVAGEQQLIKADRYGYLAYDADTKPPTLSLRSPIIISDDNMEARSNVYGFSASGQPVTRQDLLSAITAAGIKHGMDGDLLDSLLEKARSSDKGILEDQVVAHGTAPTHGKDAKLIVYKDEKCAGIELSKGRMDYHEHNYPRNVEKGTTVGYLLPAKPAVAGMTVLGKIVKATPPKKLKVELNGIHCDEKGKLIAELDGAFLVSDKRLSVVDMLVMNKDVDVRTGNIHCNTNVHIKGHIKPAFKVESKKDVIIERNVENAQVHSGGELLIKGGIRGQKSEIFAAGDVTTRFIENASVFVNGNIFVSGSIINSQVASNESITIGDKYNRHGTVIGGEVIAHTAIIAKELGSSSHAKTRIKAGIGQENRREINQLEFDIQAKKEEVLRLNQIEYHYKTNPENGNEALMHKVTATRAALLQEIANLGLDLAQLNKKIEAASNPTITVEKYVYPGVTIELGSHRLEIRSKLGAGVFSIHDDEIVFRSK